MVTGTMVATIEYCVHVAIIFNEVLMNKDVKLDVKSIDKYERIICCSMKYFEDWKNETDNMMRMASNQLERLELSKCFFVCGDIH